jgi:hypothetical protein
MDCEKLAFPKGCEMKIFIGPNLKKNSYVHYAFYA